MAAPLISKFLKLDLELTKALLPKAEFVFKLDDKALAVLKNEVDTLIDADRMESPFNYETYVYPDLLREIEAIDSNDGARFVQTMREFRPRIVINNVRTAEDIKLGFAVSSVCRKYFGIEAEYLGYVNQDEDVRHSVTNRTPLVEFRPKSDASIYLDRIARKLALAGNAAGSSAAGASAKHDRAASDTRARVQANESPSA